MCIVDARSKNVTRANQLKGGGGETPDVYTNCQVKYLDIANIHGKLSFIMRGITIHYVLVMHTAFDQFSKLCENSSAPDFSKLQQSEWVRWTKIILEGVNEVIQEIANGKWSLFSMHMCNDSNDEVAF